MRIRLELMGNLYALLDRSELPGPACGRYTSQRRSSHSPGLNTHAEESARSHGNSWTLAPAQLTRSRENFCFEGDWSPRLP